MKKKFKDTGEASLFPGIVTIVIILLLQACNRYPPVPRPPPIPILPRFEWLVVGLIIFAGAVLWKKVIFKEPVREEYLTEAINDINDQLLEIEKKIDELKKDRDRSDED